MERVMAVRAATERRVGARPAKATFYLLALASGVFYALSVTSDVFIYKVLLPDPIALGLAEQWVGFLFTGVALLVLSIPTNRRRRRSLGTRLDRTFYRVALPSRRVLVDILLAGLFGGASTFAYYHIAGTSGDVSAVLPFSRLSLIYLLIGDLILMRDYPTPIEVQSILGITMGVILVGSSGGYIDLNLLLFVSTAWGGGVAASVFFQSRAKRREIKPGITMDSLNLRLWLLLSLNTTMTLMTTPFITPTIILLLYQQLLVALPWLLLPVAFTFLSLIAYLQALGRGKMSVVQGINSVSVVLGIPLNLLGALILPGVYEPVAPDLFTWIIKIIGTIFVVSGIVALSLSEMKAYVLVRLKPGAGDLLPQLRRIQGVKRVSAIAGPWDLLLRIHIRSLGSVRLKTLRKIEETPGVQDMMTLLILKEWD